MEGIEMFFSSEGWKDNGLGSAKDGRKGKMPVLVFFFG
jgi:hypothetical protein